MANVHLIADEKLGGGPNGHVQREFIEVERKAVVGEYIVITNVEDLNHDGYDIGHMDKVTEVWKSDSLDETGVDGEEGISYFDREYNVLEPTGIVVIDGQRYELAERDAEIGDTVVMHDYLHGKTGDVLKVSGFDRGCYYFYGKDRSEGSPQFIRDRGINGRIFHVLQPVAPSLPELLSQITQENAHAEQEREPDIYAILANLTRRVKSLESQLRDTQGNVERQAQELGNLEGRTKVIDSISDFYAEGQR